jgi:hypothetical protein
MASEGDRVRVAELIDQCPPIPRAGHTKAALPASSLLGPLVACLDPSSRFPILNNAKHVQEVLAALGVRTRDTVSRLAAMMKWINHAGIPDSFYLDTAAIYGRLDAIRLQRRIRPSAGKESTGRKNVKPPGGASGLLPLGWYDEEEVRYFKAARHVKVRNVHKRMTNALVPLFDGRKEAKRGLAGPGQFDVLVSDYSDKGRDLLIEVKSLVDPTASRLAVGQLQDYRRHVTDPANTDMAVLFPRKPPRGVLELLAYVHIGGLWFTDGGSSESTETGDSDRFATSRQPCAMPTTG